MSRGYGYRRRSRHGRSNNAGLERAREHIRQAKELSAELGGTDEDVKEYFFSLSPAELKVVFDEYERRHGQLKREYAEEAMPLWKSRVRHMSGLVAGRLFDLLPPSMPLDTKYGMVKTLWKKHCPGSNRFVVVGPDATVEAVSAFVESHLMEVVLNYKIPEPLERRFRWLSTGDVNIYQQLLNHFLETEKQLVIDGVRRQIPILLQHLRQNGDITRALTKHIEIGKHHLELTFDSGATGVKNQEAIIRRPAKSGCMVLVAACVMAALGVAWYCW